MFAGSVPTTFSGLMARTCCWLRSRSSAGPTKLLVEDQTLFTSWHISLQYVTHWQTYPLIPLCVYPRFKAGSVQFSRSVMFDFATSRTTALQASLSSPTPGACSKPCPLSQWCHPSISSSVVPFSSCLRSFPASGSFPVSQFFSSGGQSIGASTSASVLPMNIQDWRPLGVTGLISLQSTGNSKARGQRGSERSWKLCSSTVKCLSCLSLSLSHTHTHMVTLHLLQNNPLWWLHMNIPHPQTGENGAAFAYLLTQPGTYLEIGNLDK